MPKSKIPSPARSQGANQTPRRNRSRRSHSVNLPGPSNISTGRLTALIKFNEHNMDSLVLSPMNSRLSVLTDNTEVEDPRGNSWWKKLDDDEHRRDVLEVLEHNEVVETQHHNILDELELEVLSPEKNDTLEFADSSESESICSIVLPPRKLFGQKENVPQNGKRFDQLVITRESMSKDNEIYDKTLKADTKTLFGHRTKRSRPKFPASLLNISNNTINDTEINDKTLKAHTKTLFGHGSKRSRPIFPASLLNISNKTIGDKTKDMQEVPRNQVRKLFGNRPTTKRKIMVDDFIVAEIEDEIPEIEPRLFTFQRKIETSSRGIRQSTTPNVTTEIDMDEWKMLPSSTMDEHQLEKMNFGLTPVKMARLSKLSNTQGSRIGNMEVDAQPRHVLHKSSDILRRLSNFEEINNEGNEHESNINQKHIHEEVDNDENNFTLAYEDDDNKLTESEENENVEDKETNVKYLENDKTLTRETATNSKVEIDQQDENKQNISEVKQQNESQVESSNDQNKSEIEEQNDSEDENEVEQNISQVEASSQQNDSEEEQQNDSEDEVDHNESEVEASNDQNESEVEQQDDSEGERNESQVKASNDQNDSEDENEVEQNISQVEASQQNYSEGEQQNDSEDEQQNDLEDEQNKSQVEASNDQNESEVEQQDDSEDEQNDSEDEQNDSEDEQNESQVEASNDQNGSEVEQQDDSEDEQNESQVKASNDQNDSEDENEVEQNISQVEASDQQNDSEEEQQNDSEDEQNKSQSEASNDQNESEVEQQDDSEDEQNESQVEASNDQNDSEDENEDEQNISQVEASNQQNDNEEEQQNDSEDEQQDDSEDEQNESQVEASNQQNDSEEEQENDSEDEQNESQVVVSNEQNDSDVEESEEEEIEVDDIDIVEENENYSDNEDEDQVIQNDGGEQNLSRQAIEETEEIAETPSTSHDTTGRKRHTNKTQDATLETRLDTQTHHQNCVSPSHATIRGSLGIYDGTKDSSNEGSGWDSHRTTRKTIRQTFGKNNTLRKSLRTLVMEKSANVAKDPQPSTSREFNDAENVAEQPEIEESNHEASRILRQKTLEIYLQEVKKRNTDQRMKIKEKIESMRAVQNRNQANIFKIPARPIPRKPTKPKSKPQTINRKVNLPAEILEDMKYKPPKRFRPSNASWLTKRLYNFLESKLAPRYDYKARVRAEKLAEYIYKFSQEVRRRLTPASAEAVRDLKLEMARLDIVRTHFEFYEFFREFMPRDIKTRVVPDLLNNLPLPRHGVFSDIL